jgi:hypothetical protein
VARGPRFARPRFDRNDELAISHDQCGTDESDHRENGHTPSHLHKSRLSNQGSSPHRGSCSYGSQSAKEQQESSQRKHGFAQDYPLRSVVVKGN